MSDQQTNRYRLPFLLPSQAQKHITVNEALRILDSLSNLAIIEFGRNDPPSLPQSDQAYVIGENPTGDWAYHPGEIAIYVDGAWDFGLPFDGLQAFDLGSDSIRVWKANNWVEVNNGGSGAPNDTVDRLGINTVPDDTNKLAVKSSAVLLSHDDNVQSGATGDLQLVLNKAQASDFCSLLFQSGFQGRAEMGCTGDDSFHVKVSSDGSNFTDAINIDASTGNVGIGAAPTSKLSINETLDGDVSRLRLVNDATSSGSGVAVTLSAGGSQITQFLQYSASTAYLVTSSRSFIIQATGTDPLVRFYAGSIEAVQANQNHVRFGVPARMPNFSVANLPSPSLSGAGAMVFVSDEAGGSVPAFSDGQNWRRTTDRTVVT